MYVRYGALNGARQIDIKLTLHIGRQTGLHTDLSCPQINRLLNAAYDLFHWQEVALFAAIGTAECAKAAMFHTHIREIDIDLKSTRLNSSHTVISYAVFCLKKKKKNTRNK